MSRIFWIEQLKFVNPDLLLRVPFSVDALPGALKLFRAAEALLPDFLAADFSEFLGVFVRN